MARYRSQIAIAVLCAGLFLAFWVYYGSASSDGLSLSEDNFVDSDVRLRDSAPSVIESNLEVRHEDEHGTISRSDRSAYLSMNVRVTALPEDLAASRAFISEVHPYFALVDLAESGSSVAAYYLYRLLMGCRNGYSSAEQLEAAVERLHQTRTYPAEHADNLLDDERSAADVEANTRRVFERCADVTDDMTADAENWLEMSSDSGNRIARDDFGQLLVREDPVRAAKHYQAIWEEGGALGAHGLSLMYERGWPGQEPDRVKSIAFIIDCRRALFVGYGGTSRNVF